MGRDQTTKQGIEEPERSMTGQPPAPEQHDDGLRPARRPADQPQRWSSAMNLARLQRPSEDEEGMPRPHVTRQRKVAFAVFVVSVVAFLYFVLPRISGPHGLSSTWGRIQNGNVFWIAIGVGFEVLSFCGYIAVFRAVFARGYGRIGWTESYQITMAGLAASRLFAAGGAGGIALTAWAVRRSARSAAG